MKREEEIEEALGYIWSHHPLARHKYCLAASGNVYQVSDDNCTCAFRMIHARECKHQRAYKQMRAAKSAERV